MSIVVDTSSLRDLASYSRQISSAIGSAATSVSSVRSSLPSKVLSRGGISSSLNSTGTKIGQAQNRVEKLSSFLTTAANEYSDTEQRINTLYATAVENSNTAQSSGSGVKIGKTANDLIGEFGFIGNILAFFTKPIASWLDSGVVTIGVTGAKSVTSVLKDGNSALKGLSEWAKSNKQLDKLARMLPERANEVRIKRLFGLDDLFSGTASKFGWGELSSTATWLDKATSVKGWGSRFYNNFHKMKSPFESYTSGGAKAAFAWTGLALTAVSNTISNTQEAKSGKISTKRAVAETITETAIDVGKGWLIGTAVAAGVAATVGSAPVLVVGALTVGVTLGLDWACKKITGAVGGEEKGLTETVSDFALDVGSAAVKGVKNMSSSVTSFVKSGWSSLKSSVGRGFSPLFST